MDVKLLTVKIALNSHYAKPLICLALIIFSKRELGPYWFVSEHDQQPLLNSRYE